MLFVYKVKVFWSFHVFLMWLTDRRRGGWEENGNLMGLCNKVGNSWMILTLCRNSWEKNVIT